MEKQIIFPLKHKLKRSKFSHVKITEKTTTAEKFFYFLSNIMGKLWSSGLLLELVSNLLVRWFLEINLGIPTSYFKQVLTMNIKKVSFKISMWKLWSSGTFGNWPLLFSLSISLILSNLSHCGTVKAVNLKYRHKHPICNQSYTGTWSPQLSFSWSPLWRASVVAWPLALLC